MASSVVEALAPIIHRGLVHCGIFHYLDGALPVAINLATWDVTYMAVIPSHGKRVVPFQQWVEEQGIGLEPPQEPFVWECRHNVLPDLEAFFLDSAETRHRNLATQASLTLLASLLAPRFCSPWKKGKLNLFHCTVCSSGAGKAAYLKGIDRIMTEVLPKGVSLSIEPPGSPEGLLAAAARRNFGLISIPEAARLLQPQVGTPMDGILSVMESIWANEKLKGKLVKADPMASIDVCVISAFMQMTTHQFGEILENQEVATGGLASRTSWGRETADAQDNDSEIEIDVPWEAVHRLQRLCAPMIAQIEANQDEYRRAVEAESTDAKKAAVKPKPLYLAPYESVPFGRGAKELFVSWKKEFKAVIKTLQNQPCLASMYIRLAEKILREATLVCIYEQWDCEKKYVTVDALMRVRAFNDILLAETKEHFNIADGGNDVDKMKIKIVKRLMEHGPSIPNKELRDKTKSRYKTPKVYEIAINQLVYDSVIEVKNEVAKNGKKHHVVHLIEGAQK